MPWKVVAVPPSGELPRDSAFELLYSFPTKEEAEEHAKNFSGTAMKLILVEKEKAPA
jgi:hypothetical protein